MRFLLAAFLFLTAVVVFTLIAKVVYQGSVETELERQSVAALRSAGFGGIEVAFDQHEATLSGYVDEIEDIEKARGVVQKTVPMARLPDIDLTKIIIRPTVPPEIKVESSGPESAVMVSGTLGEDGAAVRTLIKARLQSRGLGKIEEEIGEDPKRLPFEGAAEFAAAAVELVNHSETARVSLAGRVLTVSGTVPNDGIKEGILELASMVAAEKLIDEISVVDPGIFLSRTTLILTRNRFGITLSGVRSLNEKGADVAGMLRQASPGTVVNDRRTSQGGRTAGNWEAHAATVVPALTKYLSGEMTVEFTEEQIRLSGETPDRESREKLLAAIQPILNDNPDMEVLADLSISDPNGKSGPTAFFHAVYEEGLLTLKGKVPADGFVAPLEEALLDLFPDLLVKNALEVSPEIPAGPWTPRLNEFLVEALPRIKEGSFHFTSDSVKLKGTTVALTDKAILQNVAVNTVPTDFTIENQLLHADEPFPQPNLLPEARTKLTEALKQQPIYFDTNSEIVNAEGREKLKVIVDLMKQAGGAVKWVVTGFADNVGNEEYNRQLSLRRAAAVVEALAALEVPKESLVTESKGEDVSGVARSERWKSRRVEISIAPPAAPGATP